MDCSRLELDERPATKQLTVAGACLFFAMALLAAPAGAQGVAPPVGRPVAAVIDDYVREGNFDSRNLADMVEEFATLRRATVQLFRPLNETEWLRHGKANENEVSVRALAYIIAGHELHHMGVLRTRYLQS